jgi:exo-beta-1,3-glucanase (GH17 family)
MMNNTLTLVVITVLSLLFGPLRSIEALNTSPAEPNDYNHHAYLSVVQTGIVKQVNFNFSPYKDNQGPGALIDESQIRERLAIIAPYTRWVRSFSCADGIEATGRIAHEMGMKVAMNAWIGNNDATNDTQINCLVAQANAGNVDLAIVGSETILRFDPSPYPFSDAIR